MIHHPHYKKRTIDHLGIKPTVTADDPTDRKISSVPSKAFSTA